MEALRLANGAARFVLELCALAALGYWGYDASGIVLAVVAPLLGAAFWGALVAPKARFVLPAAVKFACELLVFAAAVAGLLASGQRTLALVLAIAYAANRVVLELIGEPALGARD